MLLSRLLIFSNEVRFDWGRIIVVLIKYLPELKRYVVCLSLCESISTIIHLKWTSSKRFEITLTTNDIVSAKGHLAKSSKP